MRSLFQVALGLALAIVVIESKPTSTGKSRDLAIFFFNNDLALFPVKKPLPLKYKWLLFLFRRKTTLPRPLYRMYSEKPSTPRTNPDSNSKTSQTQSGFGTVADAAFAQLRCRVWLGSRGRPDVPVSRTDRQGQTGQPLPSRLLD